MFRAGNLTHVVFVKDAGDAEGDARRLDRIVAYRTDQCAGLEVVGVGWVEACARAGSMVGVAKYVVDEEAGGRRGMPPRLRLEDDGGANVEEAGQGGSEGEQGDDAEGGRDAEGGCGSVG